MAFSGGRARHRLAPSICGCGSAALGCVPMSLRMRLFVLLGALVAGLVLAEGWLVRTLARDLSNEAGQLAYTVSESVVTTLAHAPSAPPASAEPATPLPAQAPEMTVTALARPARRLVTERVIQVEEI